MCSYPSNNFLNSPFTIKLIKKHYKCYNIMETLSVDCVFVQPVIQIDSIAAAAPLFVAAMLSCLSETERERRTWRGGDLERSAHSSHPSILPEQRCVIGRHRSPLCGLKDILTTAGMMDFLLLLTAALSVSSGASAASLCEYSCGSTRSLLFLLLSQSDVEPAGLTLCLWGTATSHRMKVSLSYLLLLSLFHTVTFMEDFQSESGGKQPSAFS